MTFQAVATLSNRESLCICEITTKEAELAQADSAIVDGFGLYLVCVDNRNASGPASVLAKFASEDAAVKLAQFFRIHGALQPAA